MSRTNFRASTEVYTPLAAPLPLANEAASKSLDAFGQQHP
jgi:hypothetical protein